ncbi:MAG: putative glutamine amidotransferase [Oceanospirillaceae bacterium]|jgi:putative glutamine amidotransferase
MNINISSLAKASDSNTPLVGVLANTDNSQELLAQTVDNKYLIAVINGAGATPIIIPTILSQTHLCRLFDLVDGIILTGDSSNIDPMLYGVTGNLDSHGPFDKFRDASAMWLINKAFNNDIPILGICRGMQEMNVALGGTIQTGIIEKKIYSQHQKIDYELSVDQRYAHSHSTQLSEKGLLKKWLGVDNILVNSLHEQAVDKLGEGLVLDASSQDHVIEAFHHPDKRFFLGVQWHVEYELEENPISMAILKAFTESLYEVHLQPT